MALSGLLGGLLGGVQGLFDGISVSMLLLEGDVGAIEVVAGALGQDVQGQLEDRLGPFHLPLPLLELRELDVEPGILLEIS